MIITKRIENQNENLIISQILVLALRTEAEGVSVSVSLILFPYWYRTGIPGDTRTYLRPVALAAQDSISISNFNFEFEDSSTQFEDLD